MKPKNIDHLIKVTDEMKIDALKRLNLTKKDLDETVALITEWFDSQPHLPRIIPDRGHIECIFLNSKGSIERTKQSLDTYYTLKTAAPDMFCNRDPLLPELKSVLKTFKSSIQYLPTPAGERILTFRFAKEDSDKFIPVSYFKYMFMALDLKMRFDCIGGCIYIIDFANMRISQAAKFTPGVIKTTLTACQGPFLGSIKGFHIIHAPSYGEGLIQIIRSCMKPKIRERMYIHKDFESLHKIVDKSLLTIEFGGTQKLTDDEMHDAWVEEMIKQRDWYIEEDNYKTDESKRPGAPVVDELLGMHGSFKKLNVD